MIFFNNFSFCSRISFKICIRFTHFLAFQKVSRHNPVCSWWLSCSLHKQYIWPWTKIAFNSHGRKLHSVELWRFKIEVTSLRTISAPPGGSFQIRCSTDPRIWCLLICLGVTTKSSSSTDIGVSVSWKLERLATYLFSLLLHFWLENSLLCLGVKNNFSNTSLWCLSRRLFNAAWATGRCCWTFKKKTWSPDCSWYDKLLSVLLHKRILSCGMSIFISR